MSELIIIEKGDEVESDTLNFNFQCLDEKVVSTNQRIETVNASIKSVQSTLNANLTNFEQAVDKDIETLNKDVTKKIDQKLTKADVSSYIVEEKYENNCWYRIYSNKWCEQGGIKTGSFNQNKKHMLLKPYPNTNYTITPICNISTGLHKKEPDGFYVIGQSGKYAGDTYTSVEWHASGFIN